MGFENTPLELKQDMLFPNDEMKLIYKLLANSMIGKWSQRANFPKTKLVRSSQEIEQVLASGTSIEDISVISKDLCEIQIQPDKSKTVNRNSNCIIGAFITSFARISLHKNMSNLLADKFKIFYVDTDSIIFSGLPGKIPPIEISPSFGDFKNEFGNKSDILSFHCLGKKNYALSYVSNGINKSSLKIRGMALTSSIASSSLQLKEFQQLFESWQKDDPEIITIPQLRRFFPKYSDQEILRVVKVSLFNDISVQRTIDKKSKTYSTYPFALGICQSHAPRTM